MTIFLSQFTGRRFGATMLTVAKSLARTHPGRLTALGRFTQQARPFSLGASANAVTVLALAPLGALFFRYKIAKPDQYLVRTGLFISDILVTKQGNAAFLCFPNVLQVFNGLSRNMSLSACTLKTTPSNFMGCP